MTTIRTRSITSKESLEFLREVLSDFENLKVKWENHKKTPRTTDTYQVTLDRLSVTALEKLLNHDLVKDVLHCPSMPPSGQGYGIDLRYRLYIQYNKKRIK